MPNRKGREAQESTEKAIAFGFAAAGFSRARRPPFFDQFRKWIAAGKQGEMGWLGKHLALRENPKRLLKGCETVISLAYPYPSVKSYTPDGFSAARYCEPRKRDYHDRLRGSRSSMLDIKGMANLVSTLLIPTVAFLVANREVILELVGWLQ